MPEKITVIHHSADFDGIFCREIARKFLPEAELIGWNFGDPPLDPGLYTLSADSRIYVLDLPCDAPFGLHFPPGEGPITASGFDKVVWIDHHGSSIASHPKNIPGYRVDGVSACRLAWQWFCNSRTNYGMCKPDQFGPMDYISMLTKDNFVARQVEEPLAVRLAGEYDVWDKRDPDAELFQHGLRSRELTDFDWKIMLGGFTKPSIREIEQMIDAGHPIDLRPDGTVDESVGTVKGLLKNGEILQYARTQENASIIREIGFTFQWEGLTFLACNSARYNSHLFTAGLRPEHDACFGFKFTGHCAAGKPCEQWSVSLYHAPGHEKHDLSAIAVKYGGGGHRGACGFQTDKLPFL